MDQAKEFFRALIPLKVRWVSQASINAAHDEEFLQLIKASGCQGLLIGFEIAQRGEPEADAQVASTLMNGGYEKALANLRRHGIRLYVTFILGYDDDTRDTTRRDAGLRQAAQLLHRGVQSPDALPRHAAIRAAARRKGGCSTTAGGCIPTIATGWCRSRRAA